MHLIRLAFGVLASLICVRIANGAVVSPEDSNNRPDHLLVRTMDSHGFKGVRVFAPAKLGEVGVLVFLKPKWLGTDSADISRRFARNGRIVIEIDPESFVTPRSDKRKQCSTFSDCIIVLSAASQKAASYSRNHLPVLLSIGEAGKFAEMAWNEAPQSAFNSIISVDYCPKSEPRTALEPRTRWTILESAGHPARCRWHVTRLLGIDEIERVSLKSNPRFRIGPMIRWVDQRLAQIARTDSRAPAALNSQGIEDLQTVVLEPRPKAESYDAFVVLYSGDGGWAEFTDELAAEINRRRLPVIGINSMRYFWKAKDPEHGAQDLERIVRHYSQKWQARAFHAIGFSFGAGTLPFFIRRLPKDIKDRIGKIAMLAPERKADFKFYFSDWLFENDRGIEILPEIRQMNVKPRPLCIYPALEKKSSLCTQVQDGPFKAIELPGDHHFNGETIKVVGELFHE